MTQPVTISTGSIPADQSAMPVDFVVRNPLLPNPSSPILISICIIIIIGGVSIRIYIGKNSFGDGNLTTLSAILPIGSIIESTSCTYIVGYNN